MEQWNLTFTRITPFCSIFHGNASLDNAAIPEIERALQELCNLNCCILFVTHRREWIPKDARTLRLQERAWIQSMRTQFNWFGYGTANFLVFALMSKLQGKVFLIQLCVTDCSTDYLSDYIEKINSLRYNSKWDFRDKFVQTRIGIFKYNQL